MKSEAKEFRDSFKQWERSIKSEQKLKVAQIDKLQCEKEHLQDELKAKENELRTLSLTRNGRSNLSAADEAKPEIIID